MAITSVGSGDKEQVAVVASRSGNVKGKPVVIGGDEIVLLTREGTIDRKVPLRVEKPLQRVMDLAADRRGHFYVQAEPNAVYHFSPEGKFLKVLGGNPTSRSEDGSEVLHTVAIDSKGNVYTFAWGNPGLVTRFDADGKTVTQRGGQFQFADPGVSTRATELSGDRPQRPPLGRRDPPPQLDQPQLQQVRRPRRRPHPARLLREASRRRPPDPDTGYRLQAGDEK